MSNTTDVTDTTDTTVVQDAPVESQETVVLSDDARKIERRLSSDRGHPYVSSSEFSADAVIEVASLLESQGLLDNAAIDGNDNLIDYGEAGEYLLVKAENRFRLIAVPGTATLLSYQEIADFARRLVVHQIVKNAGKPDTALARLQSLVSAALPRLSEEPYKRIGPVLLAALCSQPNGVAFRALTDKTFRDCLTSSIMAKALMPGVAAGVWVKLLNSMIDKAEKSGMPSLLFRTWLESRDKVQGKINEISDINMEDLAKAASAIEDKREQRSAKARERFAARLQH